VKKTARVLGVALIASSVALIGAAGAATANGNHGTGHTPVGVCHATSSDTNPYVWIVVDDDSTKYKGHLMHRNDPNKHWKSAGTWNGITHKAGSLKRDYIQGLDDITQAQCESPLVTPTPTPTTPTPTPTDTPTETPMPTVTPTVTPTDTPSVTPSPTETPTPSDTPTPTATPTTSKSPTVVPTPEPSSPPPPPKRLAKTGASTPVLALSGLLAALVGIALVASTYRKPHGSR
jgi:LPXTG-motif cell wall-anchored protein